MKLKKAIYGIALSLLAVTSITAKENKPIHQPTYVEDQIIVQFKPFLPKKNKANFLLENKFSIKKEIKLATKKLSVIKVKSGLSIGKAIEKLQNSGLIEFAEPDYLVSTQHHMIPDDNLFEELWAMNNTGQTGGLGDADIDAVEAWNIQSGNDRAIVAVIDSGVDYEHIDLANNMWRNPGEIPENEIDDDNNGYIDDIFGIDCADDDSDPMPTDNDPHGTHVAGIIGAQGDNETGVTGVNWTTRIMALKFLSPNDDGSSSGSISDAIECLNYANMMSRDFNQNIAVTNNSWGAPSFSQALSNAIDESESLDILFVAAAGNNARDNDRTPLYPSSYTQEIVLSVAGTNDQDGLYEDTNFGSNSVDLGAPGESIWSTIPNNRYSPFDGTSMAAPHVSGAAMLLLASDSTLSARELKDILMNYGDNIEALNGKTVSGNRLNIRNSFNALLNTISLNKEYSAKYGWNFDGVKSHRENIHYSFNSNDNDRWLHVRAYDVDNNSEVCIEINRDPLRCLAKTPNNRERVIEQVVKIPENTQHDGENIISFIQSNPGWKWGITDVGLFNHPHRYLPALGAETLGDAEKVVGNNTPYGWKWKANSNKTTLNYGFYSSDLNGYRTYIDLRFKGYDIDNNTEVCINLNNTRIKCLPKGTDNSLKSYFVDLSNHKSLIKNGLNTIQFIQKTPGERWGISGISLIAYGIDWDD